MSLFLKHSPVAAQNTSLIAQKMLRKPFEADAVAWKARNKYGVKVAVEASLQAYHGSRRASAEVRQELAFVTGEMQAAYASVCKPRTSWLPAPNYRRYLRRASQFYEEAGPSYSGVRLSVLAKLYCIDKGNRMTNAILRSCGRSTKADVILVAALKALTVRLNEGTGPGFRLGFFAHEAKNSQNLMVLRVFQNELSPALESWRTRYGNTEIDARLAAIHK